MSQRAAASLPAGHNAAKSPKAELFSEQDALEGTCFCPRLAPSGRHAKASQPIFKGAECRIPPLRIFASFRSNPSCWCGLSRAKATCLVEAAHARQYNNAIVFLSPSSHFYLNTEIKCKEIIGLAGQGFCILILLELPPVVSVRCDISGEHQNLFYSIEKIMFGVMRWRHLEDKWMRAAFVWTCRSEWRPSGKLVTFA